MFRVWFDDLEKAIAAFRKAVDVDGILSINRNVYGNFVFKVDSVTTYVVHNDDFSVWYNDGDWRQPNWIEVK